MSTVPEVRAVPRSTQTRSRVKGYAKTCGVLVLLSIVAGGFGEGYVPSRMIVPGDAAATVARFRDLDGFMRLGVAGYLVEAICDVALVLVFYELLRPVRRDLALLAACFGLVGTAIYAVGEMFFFGVSSLLGGADYLRALPTGQIEAQVMLWLKVFGLCGVLSILFYGIATLLRGYLIIRSGFLPAWLGALLMFGGLAFVTRTFAYVLAPSWSTAWLLPLMAPGGLTLTAWLLVRGVDVAKWEARAAAMDATRD